MSNEPIPEVFPLIQQGIAIYKHEFDTFIKLTALYLAFSFLGLAAFIGSIFLVAASTSDLGVTGLGLASVVGVVVFVVFWWILLRVLLAILYTVRDHHGHLSVRQALMRGRGKVWGFLWVNILAMLVVVGTTVVIFIIGSIILFPFFYVAPQIVGGLAVLLVWLGMLISILVTCTWFAFSTWLFIDKGDHGLHALAVSKHLAHTRLGSIMWRLFCIGIIYVFIYIVLELVLGFLFSFLPYQTDVLLAELVSNIIVCMTIIPVLYGAFFSLYSSVMKHPAIDTESKAHGEHRGILATLAVFGFLFVCVLPFMFAFAASAAEQNTEMHPAYQTHLMRNAYVHTSLMNVPMNTPTR